MGKRYRVCPRHDMLTTTHLAVPAMVFSKIFRNFRSADFGKKLGNFKCTKLKTIYFPLVRSGDRTRDLLNPKQESYL